MNCASVTIVETNGTTPVLESPEKIFGGAVSGVQCATIIQDAEEPIAQLSARVRRRLSSIAEESTQRCVTYYMGEDQSVTSAAVRRALCDVAMEWLTHSAGEASLRLLVPDSMSDTDRHKFLRLVGELTNINPRAVNVSLVFARARIQKSEEVSRVRQSVVARYHKDSQSCVLP